MLPSLPLLLRASGCRSRARVAVFNLRLQCCVISRLSCLLLRFHPLQFVWGREKKHPWSCQSLGSSLGRPGRPGGGLPRPEAATSLVEAPCAARRPLSDPLPGPAGGSSLQVGGKLAPGRGGGRLALPGSCLETRFCGARGTLNLAKGGGAIWNILPSFTRAEASGPGDGEVAPRGPWMRGPGLQTRRPAAGPPHPDPRASIPAPISPSQKWPF